jgi:hypothetical protein
MELNKHCEIKEKGRRNLVEGEAYNPNVRSEATNEILKYSLNMQTKSKFEINEYIVHGNRHQQNKVSYMTRRIK